MMIIIIVVGCLTLSRLSLSQSDESSPMEHRYNALFSAQCKARCLYEYRSDSQQQSQPQQHQQRSLLSIYPDGKSNRILVKIIFFLLTFNEQFDIVLFILFNYA